MMGFIQNIIEKHQKRAQDRNAICAERITLIDNALNELNNRFSDSTSFVDPQEGGNWQARHKDVIGSSFSLDLLRLGRASQYKTLTAKQKAVNEATYTLSDRIASHNERVARGKLQTAYSLIGDVEGRRLDEQQMICVVKEAHNQLVIAGAGTGKTTTIVGKIKYLLQTGQCQPEDILVLSFTNASASEMRKRIAAETGEKIAAATFHKLGLHIISQVNGVMPKITQIGLRKLVKEQLVLNMQSDEYLGLLNTYLLFNRVAAKSEFDFQSKKEYEEYLRLNPPTTINNETVKSYGEMDIANFLMKNSIRYIYEFPYEVDTRTSEYGQYHPDFYLPDFKVYIEYFGINRRREVPSYFEASNGMSATEAYRATMDWKRTIHRENQTVMIECYAYEKFEGTLLENLQKKLEAESVTLSPKSSKELWAQIVDGGDSLLDGLIELFETLINLIKSNNYSIETVRELNTGSDRKTNDLLLKLLEPIFNAYNQYLLDHGEIDFNDMINQASSCVRQGKYVNPYKYVIVDEYQDISKARFGLLAALRESSDYNLFCVGDDWQSIYRFAGSDIGFILDFEKYWGAADISKIETTYRFPQSMIEVSSGFVMRNPVQVKKSIKGRTDDNRFPLGEIYGFTDRAAVEFMVKKLEVLPKDSSVFFLGRYTFDGKL